MNEALKRALFEQQREHNRFFKQITTLRNAEETIDGLTNLGIDISWIGKKELGIVESNYAFASEYWLGRSLNGKKFWLKEC